MLGAGLYRMARPKAFGGLELDPVTIFRLVEEVARPDSAAGWNLNLANAVDGFLAWLPDEGAEEILDVTLMSSLPHRSLPLVVRRYLWKAATV